MCDTTTADTHAVTPRALGLTTVIAAVLAAAACGSGGDDPKPFGQRQTFPSGITVEITQPQPAKTEGVLPEPDTRAVVAEITVVNNRQEVYDTNQLQTIATADGRVANGVLIEGTSLTRPSLPAGQKVTYKEAWMVPTRQSVPFRLQVSTSFGERPLFFEGEA
jgi:hypothetical protein